MTRKEKQETDDNKMASQSHQLKQLGNITSITKKLHSPEALCESSWPSKILFKVLAIKV